LVWSGKPNDRPTTAPVDRVLLLAAAALLLSACGAVHHATRATAPAVDAAVRLCDPGDGSSLARARECYQRRLLALVSAADAPATELPQVRSRRSEARAGPTFRSPAARSSPRPTGFRAHAGSRRRT
jgi:hypothetical protein